ncbi:Predicted phosphodiesterase [Parafrankia irregularis]|uniref:Predicted phosphodiesterase n=1 Tax=Parafrankia irregularis TaxID=795642 RepID=A0A0S4QTP3_9ACTN|nr:MULTISPECIES: metallophosphoesterase family protein [Parafrankia]MBE3203757.1 metallophosphoesterase family protein [Parafrankia sp. CH37]CUU58999.1 Predicted phosphodiesterase [Parafrankia irregularis]
MRYAVMADLHGKRKALRRVLAAADKVGVDEVVCLGDYLEAKVPWRRHDPARFWPLDEVVDPDPELWADLVAVRRILGNQEERIRDLLTPEQTPDLLAPLLSGQSMTHIDCALGMHGHQIGWSHDEVSDSYLPRVEDVPAVPLILVGHTHRRAVFEIRWDAEVGDGGAHAPAPGAWREDEPEVDERVGSVRSVPVVSGVPVPVPTRAVGGRGLVTTVVNVGPAIGRPSNWLFFDADRGEIVFEEA